jgi:hypothetical protein
MARASASALTDSTLMFVNVEFLSYPSQQGSPSSLVPLLQQDTRS